MNSVICVWLYINSNLLAPDTAVDSCTTLEEEKEVVGSD